MHKQMHIILFVAFLHFASINSITYTYLSSLTSLPLLLFSLVSKKPKSSVFSAAVAANCY